MLERTTELRAVQNDLIHAGKLAVLGQMSAGVVHELNQPLAALRTLSDNAAVLIERGRVDDARGNLQRIGNLTDRLGRLTQQLKVFAYKGGRVSSSVRVGKAVHDALALVGFRLRELDIAVTVSIDPEQACVVADEARLEQVLVNLLGNAIDAMAGMPERRLEIRAAEHGERCVITIADSGPGIRADVLPSLFEPFVTTKPAGRGLGLGLMISAHIVREFEGRLHARNRPAGGGAEFVIELQAAPSQPGERR